MENEKDYDYFQLDVLSKGSIKKTVKAIIENDEFEIDEIHEEPFEGKKGTRILSVYLLAHKRHMERISYEIKQALKVQDVAYFSVSQSIRSDEGELRIEKSSKSKDKNK